MGEAFRRARAAAFKQQRSIPYQALLQANLLALSRSTKSSQGLSARLVDKTTGLTVGSTCLITTATVQGEYQIVHGNRVIGTLPPEAKEIVRTFEQMAPALQGMFPCRVVAETAFDGVTLELDAANDTDG